MRLFRRQEAGSITVESALIMPFFMMFVITLIVLIKISIVQMALNTAVSETTKQISTHFYPAYLLYEAAKDTAPGQKVVSAVEKAKEIDAQLDDMGKTIIDKLPAETPEEIKTIILNFSSTEKSVRDNIKSSISDYIFEMINKILNPIFKPIVKYYGGDILANKDDLTVMVYKFPNLENKDKSYLGIEAYYDMQLPIPFLNKQITLKQRAYERLWIGNDHGSSSESQKEVIPEDQTEEKAKEDLVVIDYSELVHPFGRAYIIAQMPPSTNEAEITVTYKSGVSNAQFSKTNLGGGKIRWEWTVGGKTTPGTYDIKIDTGGQSKIVQFTVKAKTKK